MGMKLSQAELAKKIGISSKSIASYEAGTFYFRYKETYDALVAALGVNVNYLPAGMKNTQRMQAGKLSPPVSVRLNPSG